MHTRRILPYNIQNIKLNLRSKRDFIIIDIDMRKENLPANMPQTRLTVFVVDDEAGPREALVADLKKHPCIGEVFAFSNYSDATLPLLEQQPDVLFLDVEVPGRTGLEFIDSLQGNLSFSFRVVFYTGFSHYMLDAIRRSAFDYLLKPYKEKELEEIIERLVMAHAAPGIGTNSADHRHGAPRKIAVQAISELLLLTVNEILYTEYHKTARNWRLILTNGSEHQLRKGTSAEDILKLHPALVRVSSSCIVNLNYLSAVENSTQRCRLCAPFDNQEIYASRRYFSKLKEKFEML